MAPRPGSTANTRGKGPVPAAAAAHGSAGARRSTRLQHLPPPPPPPPPQSPVVASPPANSAKRRHVQEEEPGPAESSDEHEYDRRRRPPPPKKPRTQASEDEHRPVDADSATGLLQHEAGEQHLPPSHNALSAENLRILDILNVEVMDRPGSDGSALKRTPSQRSVTQSNTGTETTQRLSSTSAAVYRYRNLAAMNIHLHSEAPDYIQASIDAILATEVSKERQPELEGIAQSLHDASLKNVRASAGEDDFISPLHTALKSLGLTKLCTHEKADWRDELKPVAPPKPAFSSSFMFHAQLPKPEDAQDAPRKRQQQSSGEPYMSPKSSEPNAPPHTPTKDAQSAGKMLPPPFPPKPSIKTPRPDLSIGIQLTSLISAISSQGFDEHQTSSFLTWLQNETVQHSPDRVPEPMLIPVPALRALDLAFPFAVVEGKAYSTGKQIFEAENQAAVSGAYALKMQLDLDSLAERAASGSDSPVTTSHHQTPLFFTVCTQGPIHEIWAHWTVDNKGVRKFGSKIVDSSNLLLLDQGKQFVSKLDNICAWGLGRFMDSVVERLRLVARKAST